MSLDSSLKTGGGLIRHRNVLTRSERLVRLLGQGRMTDTSASVLGMPKVANRKISVGKKAGKKAEGEGDAATAAAAAPAATTAATPAAGAAKKAGAPAAGGAAKKK